MRILSFIAPLQNLPAYLHLTPAPCHLLCLGRSVHALSGPPPDSWTRIYLFYLFNDLPPIFPSISCINFSPQDHYQMHMKVFRISHTSSKHSLNPMSRLASYITILQRRDQHCPHSQSPRLVSLELFFSVKLLSPALVKVTGGFHVV